MKITIHDTVKRPWGYETLVTVDDNGTIWNFPIMTDPKKPEDIAKNAESLVTQWTEAKQAEEAASETRLIDEAKTVIIEKINYLKEKEVISDKDLTDISSVIQG